MKAAALKAPDDDEEEVAMAKSGQRARIGLPKQASEGTGVDLPRSRPAQLVDLASAVGVIRVSVWLAVTIAPRAGRSRVGRDDVRGSDWCCSRRAKSFPGARTKGFSADEVRALAEMYDSPAAARNVLDAAGLSRRRHPEWKTAELFWSEVSRLLEVGAVFDGRARLLAAAAQEFPANPALAPTG